MLSWRLLISGLSAVNLIHIPFVGPLDGGNELPTQRLLLPSSLRLPKAVVTARRPFCTARWFGSCTKCFFVFKSKFSRGCQLRSRQRRKSARGLGGMPSSSKRRKLPLRRRFCELRMERIVRFLAPQVVANAHESSKAQRGFLARVETHHCRHHLRPIAYWSSRL